MTAEAIPYEAFRGLLERLGFRVHRVPGSYVYFDHQPTGTQVVLPDSPRVVRQRHWLPARKILVERGLVRAEEFDRLLNHKS